MAAPDIALVRRDLYVEEGISLKPYLDTKGLLTIGCGRCVDKNPFTPEELAFIGHNGRTKPITMQQLNFLLDNDIAAFTSLLNLHAPWWSQLNEPRARALLELCFNMGWGNGKRGLSSFTNTLRAIRSGAWQQAYNGLMVSKWAKDVKIRRATRISSMVRDGVDYAPR